MQADDLTLAAQELERLKEMESEHESHPWRHHPRRSPMKQQHCRFPPACLRLLRGIEGNLRCVDCDASNPQWATISYGALLCIDCSGSHRQLGVQVSIVRSLSMDSWSHFEILCMLEGGNKQLNDFFHRHRLPSNHFASQQEYEEDIQRNRYKTNAAMFYRVNLAQHAKRVEDAGMYRGRDSFRKSKTSRSEGGRGQERGGDVGESTTCSSSTTRCATKCCFAGNEGGSSSEAHNTVGA